MRFIRWLVIVFILIVLALASGLDAKPADAGQSPTIYVLGNIPGPDETTATFTPAKKGGYR
jgi:hypothetical protein